MTDKPEQDARLVPCPFCGAGETHIHINRGAWTNMAYGEVVSVEVRHWCPREEGQPSRGIVRVGRDEASAIAAWNRRASLAASAGSEPVAVVGSNFALYWAGSGPIAPIVEKHGIKVGSPLYTHPHNHEPVRFLTQQEMDVLGGKSEGMDGDSWDRLVQEKFAQVNGLKIKGGRYDWEE